MTQAAPPDCRRCPNAHNGVNGRYCKLLRHYVEHSRRPPCLTPPAQA